MYIAILYIRRCNKPANSYIRMCYINLINVYTIGSQSSDANGIVFGYSQRDGVSFFKAFCTPRFSS